MGVQALDMHRTVDIPGVPGTPAHKHDYGTLSNVTAIWVGGEPQRVARPRVLPAV